MNKPRQPRQTFQQGDDGLFHCDVPGCEQPGYEHPQHLGLHRYHKHNIQRTSKPRSRPKRKSTSLAAEDVCRTILIEVAPNGMIPVGMIDEYVNWVEATQAFFDKIGAK